MTPIEKISQKYTDDKFLFKGNLVQSPDWKFEILFDKKLRTASGLWFLRSQKQGTWTWRNGKWK